MSDPKAISPQDIEAKFRELQGEFDVIEDEVRSYTATVVAVAVVAVVVVAFALGRRKGRKTKTFVEIRRI